MRAKSVHGVAILIAVFSAAGQTPQQHTIHSGAPYPDASLHWPAAKEYDTPPKLISAAAPVYPFGGPNRGLAVVSFTIDTHGIPQAARIKSSDPAFVAPTLLAAVTRNGATKRLARMGKPRAVEIAVAQFAFHQVSLADLTMRSS